MEAPEVAEFREHILEGQWPEADEALTRLCVAHEDELWVSDLSLRL